MTTLIRALAVLLVLTAQIPALEAQEPTMRLAQAPPAQQEGFVPIDQLPPQEQYAAAPLLVGAYSFVLVMLFGYMVSVSRRLGTIQREMDRLAADVKRSGKG